MKALGGERFEEGSFFCVRSRLVGGLRDGFGDGII